MAITLEDRESFDAGTKSIVSCNAVVIEVKSVEALAPIHVAQLLTYLRSGEWTVGLLINFNVAVLKDGIRRRVLNLRE